MLACVMDGQDGHGIGMSRHVKGRDQVQSGGGGGGAVWRGKREWTWVDLFVFHSGR